MGGSQATQRTKSSSTIVSDALVRNIQNCGVSYSGNQKIKLFASKGTLIIKGGISQIQSAVINTSCLSQNKMTEKIQNEIINKIKKEVNQIAKSATAGLNKQRSRQMTDIDNTVRTSITKDFIQRCANSLSQAQAIDVSSEDGGTVIIEGDIGQIITAKVISSCSQKNLSNTKLQSVFDTIDEQKLKQESAGIAGGIAEILKSSWYIFILIFIIIIAIGVAYYKYNRQIISKVV